ncbi:MAG: hypothetical protein L3J70_01040 [Gammaproteobacteria bacterium]|nr:hypothetical protein [Gammaproteobacteria bacterium]
MVEKIASLVRALEPQYRYHGAAMAFLLIMLVPVREANGAISYVQKVGGYALDHSWSTTAITIPVTASVTVGNSIIVSISWAYSGSGVVFTCSDDAGNSYSTDVSSYSSVALVYTVICSAHNVNALGTSNNITVTTTDPGGNATGAAVSIHEFSGLLPASPLDQTSGNFGGSGAPVTVSSGDTAITTQTNELLIGAIGADDDNSPIFTAGSGYTLLESVIYGGLFPGNLSIEYKTVSTTGAYRADGSLSNVAWGWSAVIATYKAAPTIALSGSCKRVDQVTDCSETGTVRFAVNGTLQPQTQTVVGGIWTISDIDVLVSGDVITIFIDGATDIREAVAVTRYDGTGNITGVELLEKHLAIGSDDNQTISNNDLSLYDSSTSGDEDIFYDVSNANDLTVDIFGAYTTEKLYIKSGNTFRPDSTGSGNVSSQDIEINGTFIADSNNITLNGYWKNNSIFNAGTSTVNFTAGSGTENIDSINASVSDFYNLSFNDGGGAATYQLESLLSVLNDLSVVDGLLNTKFGSNYAVNVGRDFLQTGGRVEARLSTITVARNFVADGSEISDGYNGAHLVMSGTGSLFYNNLSLGWVNGFRYLTVGQSNNTTTLTPSNSLAVFNQLSVGSGSLMGYQYKTLILRGIPTPLVVHADSIIDVFQLRFFGNGVQELPPLNNGYDSGIKLSRHGTIIRQTGDIRINGSNNLILDGDGFADRAVTYNTNGFDLMVGGKVQVGQGGDTVLKRLDITNNTVTVGGNIEVRSGGSVQADIVSTGSTVILNGSALQTITTNSSDFNHLTVNNASAAGVNFTDSFSVNNFTNTTANSKMTFASGQSYTINGAATLQGTSGQLITLAPSSPGTRWNFVLNSGATKVVDYVNVSWSDASGSHTTQKPILPTNSNNGGNNIDWFGSNISVNKTSALISDPVNSTGAGKNHIPGAIVEYIITTTNSGDSSPDASSITITDSVDGNVEYDVSGISFAAYNSGLSVDTVTYAHKDTPTLYNYSPTGTYDPNVAGIKITTNGTFNHSDAPDPRFAVTYRIRIK